MSPETASKQLIKNFNFNIFFYLPFAWSHRKYSIDIKFHKMKTLVYLASLDRLVAQLTIKKK